MDLELQSVVNPHAVVRAEPGSSAELFLQSLVLLLWPQVQLMLPMCRWTWPSITHICTFVWQKCEMVFLQYHLLQDIVSILDMSGNWADVNSSVSVARITGKSIWIYTATDGQSDSPCMCDLYMLTRMLSLLGFPGYAFTFVSWAALNYSFWYKMSHGLIRERQGACTTMCFIRKKKRKGRFPWPWPAHVDSHLLMNSNFKWWVT